MQTMVFCIYQVLDLQEIKEIGVDHAILNFNRSPISNKIDNIIDISKQLSGFIR
jgi:hypothetical protein